MIHEGGGAIVGALDGAAVGAIASALAAIVAAVFGWLRTRPTRPEVASQQVGYLIRINKRLYLELERCHEEIGELRTAYSDIRATCSALRKRIADLERGHP